jgi:hypothetical protein
MVNQLFLARMISDCKPVALFHSFANERPDAKAAEKKAEKESRNVARIEGAASREAGAVK